MRVFVTTQGISGGEPVRQAYTQPKSTAVDAMQAVTALLAQHQHPSPYYTITKIEIEL